VPTTNATLIAGMFVVLLVGTVLRLSLVRGRTDEEAVRRRLSLRTWWCLAILIALAALAGRRGIILLLCVASLLATSEFLKLVPLRRSDHVIAEGMVGAVVLTYAFIYLGQETLFLAFVPLLMLLSVPAVGVFRGKTSGFLGAWSSVYVGFMLTTYGLAHAAALTLIPAPVTRNQTEGAVGLALFLIILTETNDIAQSVVGRRVGRRKITPSVSPNKTWEGFLAGAGLTTLAAVTIAFVLEPWSGAIRTNLPGAAHLNAALAGLVIAVAGFVGDLTMSAIKRDAGVKDSGTLLPGQGGILDRIDSLTFSAPVFYWYIRTIHGI